MNELILERVSIGKQKAYVEIRNKIQNRREKTFKLMNEKEPVSDTEITVFEELGKLEEEINDLIKAL